MITITTSEAKKINAPSKGANSHTLLSLIIGQSLYSSTNFDVTHVTYDVHQNKTLKTVFLSDANGNIARLSNKLLYKPSIVKLKLN